MIDWLNSLQWREPTWLLLALQPVVITLVAMLVKKLRDDHVAEPHLLPWLLLPTVNRRKQYYAKQVINILAWSFFAISLAGPRIAEKNYSTDISHYNKVMIVFDISRSMLARDIAPTRLDRARLELYDLISRSEQTQLGVVVYAAHPHLLSPLTADKPLLRHYVAAISSPLLPTRGSDLAKALRYASKQLASYSGNKAILLVSDGETDPGNPARWQTLGNELKQAGITLYTLVTGTRSGSPLTDDQQGWLQHNKQGVISKAQPDFMQQLSQLTNGSSSLVTDNDDDWVTLYDHGIARLAAGSQPANSEQLIVWHELYPWFLFSGFFMFMLGRVSQRPVTRIHHLAIITLTCSLFSLPDELQAETRYQDAYHTYQQQHYQQAAKSFAQLDGYQARMGEGSSEYHLQNYKKAISQFIQATIDAVNDQQRATALFNLANSYYQYGNYAQAYTLYTDVLRYMPQHRGATINRVHTEQLLKSDNAQTVTSMRGGRGPSMARLEPGTDIGDGKVSLSNEDSTEPLAITGDDSKLPASEDNVAAQAGLVSEQRERSGADSSWTYQVNSIEALSAVMNQYETDNRVFWRRLFEWEEGFAAPQEAPSEIQGVAPW